MPCPVSLWGEGARRREGARQEPKLERQGWARTRTWGPVSHRLNLENQVTCFWVYNSVPTPSPIDWLWDLTLPWAVSEPRLPRGQGYPNSHHTGARQRQSYSPRPAQQGLGQETSLEGTSILHPQSSISCLPAPGRSGRRVPGAQGRGGVVTSLLFPSKVLARNKGMGHGLVAETQAQETSWTRNPEAAGLLPPAGRKQEHSMRVGLLSGPDITADLQSLSFSWREECTQGAEPWETQASSFWATVCGPGQQGEATVQPLPTARAGG